MCLLCCASAFGCILGLWYLFMGCVCTMLVIFCDVDFFWFDWCCYAGFTCWFAFWVCIFVWFLCLVGFLVVWILKELFRMCMYLFKVFEVIRVWYVIDVEGMVLGCICTEVARILRGKHKLIFVLYMDMGDYVIIVNVVKVVFILGKVGKKDVVWYFGYLGGLKIMTYVDLFVCKFEEVVCNLVCGMLFKGLFGC